MNQGVAGSNPGGAIYLDFFFVIFFEVFYAKKVLYANRRNMQRKREKTLKNEFSVNLRFAKNETGGAERHFQNLLF